MVDNLFFDHLGLHYVLDLAVLQDKFSDFVDRRHLDGENNNLECGCIGFKHPNYCMFDSLSTQTPTSDHVDREHLDKENDNLESQVPSKSC